MTDVGDIVLRRGGTVVGRAVDEDGTPVVGARVRFAAMPEIVVQSGALDFRAGSLPIQQTPEGLLPFDVPGWVSALVDDLPISTAWTGEDGQFRLEGVPDGALVGGVDRAGFAAALVPSFPLGSGEERELGDIELSPGRTATGRVTDASGGPVVGATVMAGAVHPALQMGFFQQSLTDSEGRFELQGVAVDGDVAALARRSELDPWASSPVVREPAGLNVVLPSVEPMVCTVVTAEGAPVGNATVKLYPSQDSDDELQLMLAIWRGQGPGVESSPGALPGEYTMGGPAPWCVRGGGRSPGLRGAAPAARARRGGQAAQVRVVTGGNGAGARGRRGER